VITINESSFLPKQRNAQIYEEIIKELKHRASERGTELKFTAKQLRTTFKKRKSDCKQSALTMKNASGIKRF
jgi:chromosome segregation and condensation protein ScpB